MFDMPDHALDGLELDFLVTAHNSAEQGLIQSLLEDNKILSISRDREEGGSLAMFGGFAICGTDIFVSKQDYEKAKGLVDAYISGGEVIVDEPVEVDPNLEVECEEDGESEEEIQG